MKIKVENRCSIRPKTMWGGSININLGWSLAYPGDEPYLSAIVWSRGGRKTETDTNSIFRKTEKYPLSRNKNQHWNIFSVFSPWIQPVFFRGRPKFGFGFSF